MGGGSSSYPKFIQTSTMGKGQNEGGFSEEQLQMYKDCFKLMDINKDGTLDKNDLRGAFDNVGVLMSEGELDSLSRRGRRRLLLRQHGQDVPGEDGRRRQRPRCPHRPSFQGLRPGWQDRLQDVPARSDDLGRQDDQG